MDASQGTRVCIIRDVANVTASSDSKRFGSSGTCQSCDAFIPQGLSLRCVFSARQGSCIWWVCDWAEYGRKEGFGARRLQRRQSLWLCSGAKGQSNTVHKYRAIQHVRQRRPTRPTNKSRPPKQPTSRSTTRTRTLAEKKPSRGKQDKLHAQSIHRHAQMKPHHA